MAKTTNRVEPAQRGQNRNKTVAEIRKKEQLRAKTVSVLPRIPLFAALGVLLVLVLIFHSGILFGNHFLWEDFIEQEFPFRNLATSSLAQGILPHWDPYIFGGMPFLADIQAAVWYPTNLLQTLFVSDGHLSPVVMEWFILLHYFVAGAGMFLFSKKILKVDDWSSLFGAIAYAFSGYLVAQAMHQMIVYHIALFPFVALLFIRGIDDWRYSIGCGMLLGVMYLAGHPQSTLYFTFFLALLGLYELIWRLRNKDADRLNIFSIVRSALPFVLAVGLFAIQLLPSQELAALSRRDVITYDNSIVGSLTWGHALTLVLPRLFGVLNAAHDATVQYWNGPYYLSWETACYIGIFPLFFALVAPVLPQKKKYTWFFAGCAAFAFLFALGNHFFLYRIFFSLPLFDKLRTPARMLIVFEFSMCALTAIGLSKAFGHSGRKWGGQRSIAILSIIGLVWAVAQFGMINATTFLSGASAESNQSIAWAAGKASFPVLALLASVLLFYFGKIRSTVLAPIAIAVTLIELFSYGMTLNDGNEDPRQAFREQPELINTIRAEQSREISRARTRLGSEILVKRNQGAYDRLQLIDGYNPLVLQRVQPEMANPEASADLMNIRQSIIVAGNKVDFGDRPTALPRVKLYYSALVKSDSLARTLLKTDSTFHYRDTILLEENPAKTLGPTDPSSSAAITNYGQNQIETKVKTASEAMLFFSEVYYPAWQAYIDGKPSKIYRAFTTLRSVEVPPGEHTIVLRFESSAFVTGSTISIVTLLLSIGALVFLIFSRRRSHSEIVPAPIDEASSSAI